MARAFLLKDVSAFRIAGAMTLSSLPVILSPASAQMTTTTYEYDALGRLVGSKVSSGGTPVQTTVEYDAAGNRKRYAVSGSTNEGAGNGGGASVPQQRRFIVVPLNGFTIIPLS